MTAPDLYVRDGSRFVLYDRAAQHVPPIPTPQRVADDLPNVDALGRPLPTCGQHVAPWAAYTDPSGRPGCRLCDNPKGARRGR